MRRSAGSSNAGSQRAPPPELGTATPNMARSLHSVEAAGRVDGSAEVVTRSRQAWEVLHERRAHLLVGRLAAGHRHVPRVLIVAGGQELVARQDLNAWGMWVE